MKALRAIAAFLIEFGACVLFASAVLLAIYVVWELVLE